MWLKNLCRPRAWPGFLTSGLWLGQSPPTECLPHLPLFSSLLISYLPFKGHHCTSLFPQDSLNPLGRWDLSFLSRPLPRCFWGCGYAFHGVTCTCVRTCACPRSPGYLGDDSQLPTCLSMPCTAQHSIPVEGAQGLLKVSDTDNYHSKGLFVILMTFPGVCSWMGSSSLY